MSGVQSGRVRVAISTPARDPGVRDPSAFSVHVGHAQALLLGFQEAQRRGLPFDVRLDGCLKHFDGDLTPFMQDVYHCISFLGINYRHIYWQPQRLDEAASFRRARARFTPAEWKLLGLVAWEQPRPVDVPAIMDDVEHYPSVIVRGYEFCSPRDFVGRPTIADGIEWYVRLEETIFKIAGVQNEVMHVPIVTMGGWKLAKSEGREIHWGVLRALGPRRGREYLTMKAAASTTKWEWDWREFGTACRRRDTESRTACSSCGLEFADAGALCLHELECGRGRSTHK